MVLEELSASSESTKPVICVWVKVIMCFDELGKLMFPQSEDNIEINTDN